jgi:hypothetical protein
MQPREGVGYPGPRERISMGDIPIHGADIDLGTLGGIGGEAKPYTITNKMGIRWAETPGLPDISIPNNMAETDIPSYVAEKQALQIKGRANLFKKEGE